MTDSSDLISLASSFYETVPAVMHILRGKVRAHAQPEMTIPQFRILAHLLRGAQTTMSLAEIQGVSQPSMSKLVAGLESKDLVTRTQNPMDHREHFIELTDVGRDKFNQLKDRATKSLVADLRNLPEEKQRKLSEALSILKVFVDKAGEHQ